MSSKVTASGPKKTKSIHVTREQKSILKNAFMFIPYPDHYPDSLSKLSDDTGLDQEAIKKWFRNRRKKVGSKNGDNEDQEEIKIQKDEVDKSLDADEASENVAQNSNTNETEAVNEDLPAENVSNDLVNEKLASENVEGSSDDAKEELASGNAQVSNDDIANVQLATEVKKLDGVDWDTKSGKGKSLEEVARRCKEMDISNFLSERKREYLEEDTAPVQNKKIKLSKLAEQLESLETLETEMEAEIIKLKDKHKTNEEELQEKYKKEKEHLDEMYKKKSANLEQELKKKMTLLKSSNYEEEESLAKEHKNKISQKKTLENEIKTRFSPRTPPLAPSTSSLVPECPICLEGMPPPMNIFNCPNGHFVCGNCKPKVANCPKCFQPVMGRATGMEQMLRTLFET